MSQFKFFLSAAALAAALMLPGAAEAQWGGPGYGGYPYGGPYGGYGGPYGGYGGPYRGYGGPYGGGYGGLPLATAARRLLRLRPRPRSWLRPRTRQSATSTSAG